MYFVRSMNCVLRMKCPLVTHYKSLYSETSVIFAFLGALTYVAPRAKI